MGDSKALDVGGIKSPGMGVGLIIVMIGVGDSSLEEGGRTPLYTLLLSFLSFPNLCSFSSQITGKL